MENEFDEINLFGDEPQTATDWRWTFADYPKHKNGIKVFSCFSCGGGSTMGYKLAGCDVVGCCEIDPKMNEVYIANHKPKYNFLMDIRAFNELPDEQIPPELFDLDVLDGSPPCTTFSMAGDREKSWGQKKKFREGQAEQTLDDLSFVFIDTAKKLRPKTVIMENVEGLLAGNAWTYVQRIYKQFNECGYNVRHWLLKGEKMGIPQTRHRVFFLAIRNDLKVNIDAINMEFNYYRVPFKAVKDDEYLEPTESVKEIIRQAIPNTEKLLCNVLERVKKRHARYNEIIVWDDLVCSTIHAHGMYRGNDCSKLTRLDYIHCQTFPEDYNELKQNIAYICGMSVPPVMMKRFAQRLIDEGVFDYKKSKASITPAKAQHKPRIFQKGD